VFSDSVERLISNPSDSQCLLGLEFILNLSNFATRPRRRSSVRPEQREFWTNVENAVLKTASKRVDKLAQTSFALAYDCLRRGKIPVTSFVLWHGFDSLFRERRYVIFAGLTSWSIAESLMNFSSSEEAGGRLDRLDA